ncbi:unnamed protein product [Pararhodospirillum photometricum DSM 122]|uniref:Uncharacterized protein n=1 Tax=Pararhodospirillum photometricum DSM 122 TaxID=1150469 RepID=H6SRB0_PARPM|nr:unnamed protein product [Pararhodospirillum photometricum DSM 122]
MGSGEARLPSLPLFYPNPSARTPLATVSSFGPDASMRVHVTAPKSKAS